MAYLPEQSMTAGDIGFISQSGGHASLFIETATSQGLHFSKTISMGNAMDLGINDFLEYLGEDSDTQIIGLYVEGMMGGQGMMGHMMKHMMGQQGMMGGPGMMGSGMMGGHGLGIGPIWRLDLTDEQRRRVNKIQDGLRKKNWELQGKLLDENSKLRELNMADPRDPKAIGAVYGKIFDVKRQKIEASIEAANKAEQVLTKEQRQQLKQWCRSRGGGHMMGMM